MRRGRGSGDVIQCTVQANTRHGGRNGGRGEGEGGGVLNAAGAGDEERGRCATLIRAQKLLLLV